MAPADEDEIEFADERGEFFKTNVLERIPMRADKWKKMIEQDESQQLLLGYLENPESKHLLFYLNVAEDLVMTTSFPSAFTKKSCFFLKRGTERLTVDNMSSLLLVGDLGQFPLEHLAHLIKEVVMPLLRNRGNTAGWPEVLVQDVVRHFHKFSNQLVVAVGQTKGETILPLPSDESTIDAAEPGNKELLHTLESAVIDWTRQIKDVVEAESETSTFQRDPEDPFSQPGPIAELDFWSRKSTNLESIHSQLCHGKITKITEVLKRAKSSYYPAFVKIFDQVKEAMDEAQDIAKHLEPLRPYFMGLQDETTEPEDLSVCYAQIMRGLLLVWSHSKHYSSSTRIVNLLRKVCNDVIVQARNIIDPVNIFKVDPDDAIEQLTIGLKVCDDFRKAYGRLSEDLQKSTTGKAWNVQPSLVLSRFDFFVDRVREIHDVTKTCQDFFRLEKVEIGGTKGNVLTGQIQQIHREFLAAVEVFSNAEYDPTDTNKDQFSVDLREFKAKLRDWERRISAVINQGFDDCQTVGASFKLLDTFEGFIRRDAIKTEVEKKYTSLLRDYASDLEDVYSMYQALHAKPPIYANMPPTAGALAWTRALMDRVRFPMEKFQKLKALDGDEAAEVKSKYDALLEELEQDKESRHADWAKDIDTESQQKLKQPLLVKDDKTGLLKVNFVSALVVLLREVKYLQLLGMEVPHVAKKIFSQAETFRQYTGNLNLIVGRYNWLMSNMTPVERPLFVENLERVDEQLSQGLKSLNWKSHGIPQFVSITMVSVTAIHNKLRALKENADAISKITAKWSEKPMLMRERKRVIALASAEEMIETRVNEIVSNQGKLKELLDASRRALEVNAAMPSWKAYASHINSIVAAGIKEAINASVTYLIEQTTSRKAAAAGEEKAEAKFGGKKSTGNSAPLLEIKMELMGEAVTYTPDVEASKGGFIDVARTWIACFHRVSERLLRLDQPDDTFVSLIKDDEDLKSLQDRLVAVFTDAAEKCRDYRKTYLPYEYLWTSDRTKYLERFLKVGLAAKPGEALPGENTEASESDEEDEEVQRVELNPPTNEDFEKIIQYYRGQAADVGKLPTVVPFGWLKVDAKPIKQALGTVIWKYCYLFTQHLNDKVVNTLSQLENFMKDVAVLLSQEVKAGDYDALAKCMRCLVDIRDRTTETDTMWGPLKDIVTLLKKYEIELPVDINDKLEELPQVWNGTKRLYYSAKERLAPLQADEAKHIQKREMAFDEKLMDFRQEFKQHGPFRYEVGREKAFMVMDKYNMSIGKLNEEAQAIKEKEELFELTVREYSTIKQMKTDLVKLKGVWDVICLVISQVEEWKKTSWEQIDTEFMEDECKKFVKEIRAVHKSVRGWDVFQGLDKAVKNFLATLPLVSDLRSPSMRERHWKQLMKICKVQFSIGKDFKLADLLALNLHNFTDDVAGIVDRATKELSMEKQLGELSNTWKGLEFGFSEHPGTNVPLLKPDEEFVEILEDNQVVVQNMVASKHVNFFLEQVSSWQMQLSTVDSVFTIWMEVQSKWRHLESIFIGSEDIRAQLPEDSARFDTIDTDWKAMQTESVKLPNVIESCMRDGLLDTLERLQEGLNKCEKALADYMETKRRAFPRFYFISSSDLLDILSKGQQPMEVMPHLSKLFDSISTLEFEKDDKGEPTKNAIGMHSPEGEYIPFASPMPCTGPVEDWLNRLVKTMQDNLRLILGEAVSSYEEKPRDQWISEYPAQVALVGGGVWWTTEVNIAFERLEEGNETAMKDYSKKQIEQLHDLVTMIQGELSSGDRQKVMTICTIEVHARDVVLGIIRDKVENSTAFAWQSQLRLRWDDEKKDCFSNIADAEFRYAYEYLGNQPRLVITPLTDRCYITLTQALHLIMGGAPAGPAGTGKTETTKDLGRALGIPVYVFNCSEQMDYKSMGNIFKGLSSSGSWGCFDEFNRIMIEVLSVVASQFKCILDALKEKKTRFVFDGDEIGLLSSVGAFITMNPGYAGRTELPENIKALFRPVSMCVPDIALIAEIMLMAQGFTEAKVLTKKFTTLYSLNKLLLSKQAHYDWGLRAVKSVLVVAGSLRRASKGMPEEHVLFRALRDFNIPKIVAEDFEVFMGLIDDLFPGVDLERSRDMKFEGQIKDVLIKSGLQSEDVFILKAVQLEELLQVRHSVFVIGPAGSGKTEVIKALAGTYRVQGKRITTPDLNPKSVTNDELFGYLHPATREWKDGLFSTIMRDLAAVPNKEPKWIILDGDIDPMWIESLNTVMDDNKVLTLASNERIPLHPWMRLIFEIGHLNYATPATVSRAGIIFINETDIGWLPFVHSWIDRRENSTERSQLSILFDKYVPATLEYVKRNFKSIVPVEDFNLVQTLCFILEGLLVNENIPANNTDKSLYELYFVFAAVWSFGGPLFKDQMIDHRENFSKWWKGEWKGVAFPVQGSVFDYFVDPATHKFVEWDSKVEKYVHAADTPVQNVLVSSTETAKMQFFLDLLMGNKRPVLVSGAAGSGKTVLVKEKLKNLGDDYLNVNINMNFYTDSAQLQSIMEQPLEKKAGRNFGPPGTRKIVYFVDDLNMPKVDDYGTQSPHTLLRQHLDYQHWYDRTKLSLKEIHNVQYVAAMNPTAGSFTINPRLQRHFAVFSVNQPETDTLKQIFGSFIKAHVKPFSRAVHNITDKVVEGMMELHKRVSTTFLPSAVKFHSGSGFSESKARLHRKR